MSIWNKSDPENQYIIQTPLAKKSSESLKSFGRSLANQRFTVGLES